MKPQPRTPTRDYNHLDDRGEFFIKSSAFTKKIEAEARFYEELPKELKKFYPNFLGRSSEGRWPKGYAIEKIPASDASLYEVGQVSADPSYFSTLFNLLDGYLAAIPTKTLTALEWTGLIERTIIQRDLERLLTLREASVFGDIENIFSRAGFKGVDDFAQKLHNEISDELSRVSNFTVWASHGDLCLSNILVYENNLYLVDPRGLNPDEEGHLIPQYDLAKLSQCLIGAYDFINHSVRQLPSRNRHSESFKSFIASKGVTLKSIRLVESSHFLAMLPLHLSHPAHIRAFASQAVLAYQEALTL